MPPIDLVDTQDHLASDRRPAAQRSMLEAAPSHRGGGRGGWSVAPALRSGSAAAAVVRPVLIGAAAVGALAAHAWLETWRVERQNPPEGRFLDVDGVRLHYVERGAVDAPPVVLIHGAMMAVQDWDLSILGRLAANHRVIAFDRPGYGWSSRPKDRRWTMMAHAELLLDACRRLGLKKPLVVGHSWGAGVAAAMAIRGPEAVRGVVLLSGYYYPTPRPDFALQALPAIPGLGAVLRHTTSPLTMRLAEPIQIKWMFAPNPVPSYFWERFPIGFMHRPKQLLAEGDDFKLIGESAAELAPHYRKVAVPVVIMHGESDKVVDPHRHAFRLHREIPHSAVYIVPRTGHMIQHVRPTEVVEGIDVAWEQSGPGAAA